MTARQHEGRLELTWTNKQRRLHTTPEGGYEWVEPTDPRVTEVRVIDELDRVGEPDPDLPNLLIRGDALHALTALNRIPALADRYASKVRLVYIDPPFNTGQAFNNYDDNLEHSVWLSMLRDRLEQIQPLLAPNGSVWVHLDDAEVHRCRLVLDEVMGTSNFVSEITWRSSDNSNNDAKTLSNDQNTILVYAASAGWVANKEPATADRLPHYRNPDDDPRGPYFDGNPLNSPNPRENLRYELVAPNGNRIPPPPNGWRWSRETMESKLSSGEVRWREDYSGIRRRTYLADHEGLPPSNLWVDLEVTGHNRQAKYELKTLFPDLPTSELFDTPKPERLLKRIITVATDPGDLVLDCFAGSGTTAAVAHKLGRRWVAVETSAETLTAFTLPRLTMVVTGEDTGGVSTVESSGGERVGHGLAPNAAKGAARVLDVLAKSESAAADIAELGVEAGALNRLIAYLRRLDRTTRDTVWRGGGGFVLAAVGQSMFDIDVDTGDVYMGEWATNGLFARACAAHLGFTEEIAGPFVGRKGRTRLAALDGVVGESEVEHLLGLLDDGERMVVVAKAFAEGAEARLRELSPGSKLRRAPNDLVGGRLP